MSTMSPKFRKLLAAFTDEVRRKQEKILLRVAPTDTAMPNYERGYCPFVRNATQTVWSPSFDVVGTYSPTDRTWLWGWADNTISPRIRGRVENARAQGQGWSIEELITGQLTLSRDSEAIELATVAVAVMRADGLWTVRFGDETRFLALFDGPPPNRSTTFQSVMAGEMAAVESAPPPSIVARYNSGTMSVAPSALASAQRRESSSPGFRSVEPSLNSGPYSQRPPSGQTVRPQLGSEPQIPISSKMRADSVAPRSTYSSRPEREPTATTRLELTSRLIEMVPPAQQPRLQFVQMLVRVVETTQGLQLDSKMTIRTLDGDQQVPISDVLVQWLTALYYRCKERDGDGFRFVTARLSVDEQGGLNTQVNLEH